LSLKIAWGHIYSLITKEVGRPCDAEGFGFIQAESGDVFVHHSAIKAEGFGSPAEGQRVDFDLVQGQKGPAAESVIVV
jgi:CspA family cold shock protein